MQAVHYIHHLIRLLRLSLDGLLLYLYEVTRGAPDIRPETGHPT